MPLHKAFLRWVTFAAMPLAFLVSPISYAGTEDSRKLLEFNSAERLVLVNQDPAIDGTIQIVVHAKNGDGTNLSRWPLVKVNTSDGRGYSARLERVMSNDWKRRVFYRFVPMDLDRTISIEIDGQELPWGRK